MKSRITKPNMVSRRKFIGSSLAISAGIIAGPQLLFGAPAIIKASSQIKGVQIGVITYSYRSMPDQSAEATLKYVLDSGVSAIELMGDPAESFAGLSANPVNMGAFYGLMRKTRDGGQLSDDEKKQMDEMKAQMDAYNLEAAQWRTTVPMDKFEQLKKMYKDAGVTIYAFKPSTFGVRNSDAEIDYGFRAAKTLGASHVTLEHPGNDKHTLKLATMAAKHKISVAYHGHEQQTPTFWDVALSQSKYNALNLDAGHFVAAGHPGVMDLIIAKNDRISSMHIKDRQTPDHGKGNLPWGQGDTPIAGILKLMSEKKYKFPATIELEYELPAGSNAVKEVAKCLDFCRKGLGV